MASQIPPTDGLSCVAPLRQRHIYDNREAPHVTPGRMRQGGRWSVVPGVARSHESERDEKVADVGAREPNDSGSGELAEKV